MQHFESRWLVIAASISLCILMIATAQAAEPNDWLEYPTALSSAKEHGCATAWLTEQPTRGIESNGEAGITLNDWLTFAANLDGGYRNTQFFKPGHNTTFFQWDGRVELWLPPSRKNFSWGPYIRLAGITSTETVVWENAWIARPGFGFQVYPFSLKTCGKEANMIGELLGPTRLFYEYNCMHYWGGQKWWRPDRQKRAGAEYWRDVNVNDITKRWWWEVWAAATWQAVDEWGKNFETTCLAGSARVGARVPDAGVLSMFTPYLALESSLTDNYDHYWENRLLLGAGIRFAPPLPESWTWLTRFVIFAEYLGVAGYYRDSAPSSIPDYDFRIGININVGEWYKEGGYERTGNGSSE